MLFILQYKFGYNDLIQYLNELKNLICMYGCHSLSNLGRYYVEGKEIAVVYFRTLYDPKHFKSDDIWRLRRDLELSAAITVKPEEMFVYFYLIFKIFSFRA